MPLLRASESGAFFTLLTENLVVSSLQADVFPQASVCISTVIAGDNKPIDSVSKEIVNQGTSFVLLFLTVLPSS